MGVSFPKPHIFSPTGLCRGVMLALVKHGFLTCLPSWTHQKVLWLLAGSLSDAWLTSACAVCALNVLFDLCPSTSQHCGRATASLAPCLVIAILMLLCLDWQSVLMWLSVL